MMEHIEEEMYEQVKKSAGCLCLHNYYQYFVILTCRASTLLASVKDKVCSSSERCP